MDVKATKQLSERKEGIPLVGLLDHMHDLESNKCAVLLAPDCDPLIQGKSKKKKKKQKDLHSLKRLVDFNTSELLKLDKEKSIAKACSIKKQPCPPSVESKCIVEGNCVVSKDLQESGDPKTISCLGSPPKSALRGAYEELGFGVRPKLHVKWAPGVWEPPPSIVSHTVNNAQPPKNKHSKKDLKYGWKGKCRHKKNDNKKLQLITPRRDVMEDEQVEAGVPMKDLSGYDAQETQNPEPDPRVDDGPVAYGCHEGPDGLFSEKWCSRPVRVQ